MNTSINDSRDDTLQNTQQYLSACPSVPTLYSSICPVFYMAVQQVNISIYLAHFGVFSLSCTVLHESKFCTVYRLTWLVMSCSTTYWQCTDNRLTDVFEHFAKHCRWVDLHCVLQ